MSPKHLVVTREESVALVQLHRPDVLNALNQALIDELAAVLEEADRDDGVRCIILTGSARAFAAGADIREIAEASAVEMLQGYRFQQWERMRRVTKPIIAAVTGFALGGGNELAMLCDLIVAGESARFGQPEINLGLIPGAGGTQRLTRTVGKYKAMELVLTGRQMTAREAEAAGLVTRVVPDELVLDESRSLAKEIAAKAPVAVRLAKEAVLKAYDTHLEGGLEFERKCFYLLFATEDRKEGIRAFLAKRPPRFEGR